MTGNRGLAWNDTVSGVPYGAKQQFTITKPALHEISHAGQFLFYGFQCFRHVDFIQSAVEEQIHQHRYEHGQDHCP